MIFKAISKSGFLVKFAGFGEFYFTEKSGGKVSSATSEVPNGSGNAISKLAGPVTTDNITLKAPYDPGLIGQIEPLILSFSCRGYDLVVQPVDCQGTIGTVPDGTLNPIPGLPLDLIATPVGDPYIYKNARVSAYTPPDVDRKSGDYAMIEIEFISDGLIRGKSYTGKGAAIGQRSAVNILQGLDRFLNPRN
jgi:hypothetical protein